MEDLQLQLRATVQATVPLYRLMASEFPLQRHTLVYLQGQNLESFEGCEKTETLVVATSMILRGCLSVYGQGSYEA